MNREPAVLFQSVTRQFGSKLAVSDLSLRVEQGSTFGLIGPNGAGKTTTFSLIAGFIRPTHGNVQVLGAYPTHRAALRGHLGVLPQDAALPAQDRVGEFLVDMARLQGFGAAEAESEARSSLAEFGGKDWWKSRCGTLSHGMAKRVALAQAFLGKPELILLDEPTAGLDPRVAYDVRQLILARKGRSTLIISSHNLEELERVCDAAAILDHGKVVASGSMHQLTAASKEVHIQLGQGPVPLEALQAIEHMTRVTFKEGTRDLALYFNPDHTDAEAVIRKALDVLLRHNAVVSSINKGSRLEKRVMELI